MMIKIIILLLSLLLSTDTWAVTADVSEQNMKLRLINGSAFVDISAVNTLTPYIGAQITICSKTDSNQCASGYIKAAGTGETYTDIMGGTNPNLLNGNFESGDVTWTKGTGWTIGSGVATGTNVLSSQKLSQTILSSRNNKLYRFQFAATRTAGLLNASIGGLRPTALGTSGIFTNYYCAPPTGGDNSIVFQSYGVSYWSGTIDNVVVQEVLTPSSTGVTIVSMVGGATRNWATNTFTTRTWDNAGFTYTIDTGNFKQIVSGSDNMISYGLVDCEDATGMVGILILGTGNTFKNYTVVRCPGGAFDFRESATLVNSIGVSSGADITIASGKTVTGKNNLFSDAAKAGAGTYTDVGAATKWGQSTDDVFVDYVGGNFHLKTGSPAIDSGTRD